jgi:hypothetical protein
MVEKAVDKIHLGRPLQKGDISNLIPKSEIKADNMECQGGSRLDYLAYHLLNGFRHGREPIG